MEILVGLTAFAAQFRAEIANSGPPTSEHGVHFCLALGLQAAYGLPTGAIVFERPAGRRRIDLWALPLDLAIEVKFRRPIASGRSQPITQHYGDLLADFSKTAALPAAARLVVLVGDPPALASLKRNNPQLLPFTVGDRRAVHAADVTALPATAATRAIADSPWCPLTTDLLWTEFSEGWHLLAWWVQPERDTSDTR